MCYRNPVQPNYSWTENYFDKREVSLKPGWQFNRFFDRLNHGLNHLISVTDELGQDLGHDLGGQKILLNCHPGLNCPKIHKVWANSRNLVHGMIFWAVPVDVHACRRADLGGDEERHVGEFLEELRLLAADVDADRVVVLLHLDTVLGRVRVATCDELKGHSKVRVWKLWSSCECPELFLKWGPC